MFPVFSAVFLISGAALAVELVLVRVFSIGHWYHFSHLVVGTAMLGFGVGPTLITIAPAFFRKHHRNVLWLFALGFAISLPLVFQLSQNIAFDELQLIWDFRQVLYLFAYYLLFFVPFFFVGSFIALVFTIRPGKAHPLYFFSMTGSGLAVAAVIMLMFWSSPARLLLLVSATGFAAAVILAFQISLRRFFATLVVSAVLIWLGFSGITGLKPEVNISQHKALVYYCALPDSKILARRYSPLARLDCIKAPAIRHFPGLSINYKGSLPEQILIISDGDGVSAVNHFEDLNDLSCYDYVSSAVGYHLFERPAVCIIGAGGGSDVAQALALGAGRVTAVEMNSQIVDLMRGELSCFSADIYKNDDVNVVVAEGRAFLQGTTERFDLINICLLDSFGASSAALNQSHLYTIEAIEQALSKLMPSGVLSITRMLKSPPRDSLKMFATIVEALEAVGLTEPAKHTIMIRSWATATVMVCPAGFSDSQIAAVRRFAGKRCFDIVHLPGLKSDQVNRFHILDEPIYYKSVRKILSPQRYAFYRDYVYDIRPATDDRPYFFDFFKWKSLPYMIQAVKGNWLAYTEWGYLLLSASLLQAVLASSVFILLPLFITCPVRQVHSGKFATFVYFLLLGFGFMFLEMAFIQKMTLLIGHPVFGVSVTLFGFLVFAGLGSATSEHIFRPRKSNPLFMPAVVIVVLGLIDIVLINVFFDWLIVFPRNIRILLGLLIIAPLAFFMGMPFPAGLKRLSGSNSTLVPWAWGVNGFASVTGVAVGTLLAISAGFTHLAILALACYLFSAVVFRRLPF